MATAGIGHCRDATNRGGWEVIGISLSVSPNTKRRSRRKQKGGGGIINLPNTDVGPKKGHRLRHDSGQSKKEKKKKKKKTALH